MTGRFQLPSQLLRRSSLVLALALFSGCYTMNAQMPGTLRGDVNKAQTEKVGDVKIEQTNYFFLWGLVGEPPEDVFVAELQKQVKAKGGDGVANVKVEGKTGCLNLLIGYLTCSLVAPRDYAVSGDIVRIKSAPLPGKAPAVKKGNATTTETTSAQVAQNY